MGRSCDYKALVPSKKRRPPYDFSCGGSVPLSKVLARSREVAHFGTGFERTMNRLSSAFFRSFRSASLCLISLIPTMLRQNSRPARNSTEKSPTLIPPCLRPQWPRP